MSILVTSCPGESPFLIPEGTDPAVAGMVPTLAEALAAWDLLDLEIGDLAVVSGDGVFNRVAALAASWYGAHPVVLLSATGDPRGCYADAVVSGSDQETATAALQVLFKKHGRVAALESTGRRELVDLFFETVPMFARVLLAGSAGDMLTINFYVNVHRKGLRLRSGVVGRLGMSSCTAMSHRDRMERALRLLRDPIRAAALAKIASADGEGTSGESLD